MVLRGFLCVKTGWSCLLCEKSIRRKAQTESLSAYAWFLGVSCVWKQVEVACHVRSPFEGRTQTEWLRSGCKRAETSLMPAKALRHRLTLLWLLHTYNVSTCIACKDDFESEHSVCCLYEIWVCYDCVSIVKLSGSQMRHNSTDSYVWYICQQTNTKDNLQGNLLGIHSDELRVFLNKSASCHPCQHLSFQFWCQTLNQGDPHSPVTHIGSFPQACSISPAPI